MGLEVGSQVYLLITSIEGPKVGQQIENLQKVNARIKEL